MLQIRVEGDPTESQALLDLLTAAGAEVQTVTRKHRAEGFTHTYAVVRLADWPAPGIAAAPASDRRPPYRTTAYIGQPALPAAERRPARRRSR